MQKFIAVLFAIILVTTLAGCQKDTVSLDRTNDRTIQYSNESKFSGEKLECSICGQANSIDNNFCSACGCGLKASIGNSEDFYNEDPGLFEDVSQNFSLLSYLKSVSEKPLIIYKCGGIAKDEEVYNAYVIKNGKCRKYYCSTTLGELSKMTDEQILEMLEDYYQDGLSEALSTWKSEHNTANAISNGKVKLYEPRSYDISGCLFTDSTGNSVIGELLFFPQAGVAGSPYIIEYPQLTVSEGRVMKYFGTHKDSGSPWDIKFDTAYFGTGYGPQSDINQINDMYYITSSSMTTGTVYNSNYFGLKSKDNEWVRYGGTLCFRVDTSNFSLSLDTLSSSDISYVDPTVNNLLQISKSYYYAYYSSFTPLK